VPSNFWKEWVGHEPFFEFYKIASTPHYKKLNDRSLKKNVHTLWKEMAFMRKTNSTIMHKKPWAN
jgi:hypothetical protein